jgi:hypothetical protein
LVIKMTLVLSVNSVYAQEQVTDFSNPQFELSNGDVVCLGANGNKIYETEYKGLHIISAFHVMLLPYQEVLFAFPEEHQALTLSLNDSGLVFTTHTTFWLPKDSSYSLDSPFNYRSKYVDELGVMQDKLTYNWLTDESLYTSYIPFKYYHVYVDKQGNTQTKVTYEYHGPELTEDISAEFCSRLDSLLNINDEELIWFTMFNESMDMLFYGALNSQGRCIYYLQKLLEVCEERGVTSEIGGAPIMAYTHLKELYNGLMGNPTPEPFYMTQRFHDHVKKNSSCK